MGMVDIFGCLLFAIVAAGFGWWTWWRGSLSARGAVAAVLLAAVVTVSAGVRWLVPLFVFFASSSLVTKFLPSPTLAGDEKDQKPRDAVQVACNGGVYGFIALLGSDPALLLICMAVATSDTLASEVGKHYRQPTFDIVRWRRVPPGLSGGVSRSGNLGGAAGAIIVAGTGFLLLTEYGLAGFLTVTTFGILGMLTDSVLGAVIQARYRDAGSGILSDRDTGRSRLVSGRRWVTNDLVNLLAIGLMVGLGYLVG